MPAVGMGMKVASLHYCGQLLSLKLSNRSGLRRNCSDSVAESAIEAGES